MDTLETLGAAKLAIDALTRDHNADLPAFTLDKLNEIKFGTVPPTYAVYGMEALWAITKDFPSATPDAAILLCGQCAEMVYRYRFYGLVDKAYAIWQLVKAHLGDTDADTTVTAPEINPDYVAQP